MYALLVMKDLLRNGLLPLGDPSDKGDAEQHNGYQQPHVREREVDGDESREHREQRNAETVDALSLALISGVFLIDSGMKNTEMAGTRNKYFQSKEVMKPPANTPIAAAK